MTSDESDYSGGNYLVNFTAGSTKESFSIAITDDDIFELDENFFLTLVIPQPAQDIGVMRGDPFVSNITIVNDESECSVIIIIPTDLHILVQPLTTVIPRVSCSQTTFTFASWLTAQVYCGSPARSTCMKLQ